MENNIQISAIAKGTVTVLIPGCRSFAITRDQLRPLHRALSGFITKELENNPHLEGNLTRLTDILQEMDSILQESQQIIKETE